MSDVVLINSPVVLYYDKEDRQKNCLSDGDEYSFYPINLLYIAAYMMERGHTVKVMDLTSQGLTLKDIINTIEYEKPKMIGMTAMTPSLQSTVLIAQVLKRYNIPMVLGGVHITNDPDFFNRFPMFDWGVVGDGERVFYEIYTGKHPKGLIHAPRIEDLDSLPFPARHLMNLGSYRRPEQFKWEGIHMDILSSRGCPNRCTFCSIPNSGHKVRFRDPKKVIEEMESVYDICHGNFTFNDDCFTLSKKHTIAICQGIIDSKMKTRFVATTRANCLDDEMGKYLKRVGCKNLAIGVESGSERIRNQVMNKELHFDTIQKAVNICKKYDIYASLFLMIGLPTETHADIMQTVEIGPKLQADYIGIHQCTPYPCSEIFKQAIREKKIPADIIDQWATGKLGRHFKYGWTMYVPDGFTQQQIIEYKKLAYRKFYLDPRWIIRKLWHWIRHPGQFIKEDFNLFSLLPQIFGDGGTKRAFS